MQLKLFYSWQSWHKPFSGGPLDNGLYEYKVHELWNIAESGKKENLKKVLVSVRQMYLCLLKSLKMLK